MRDRLSLDAMEQPQPVLATVVGALAGAIAFALCTLWFGASFGIVVALIATLFALGRRAPRAAIAFATAGVLSAFALRPSTTMVFLAAPCFGTGLALATRPATDTTRADENG